MCQVHPTCNPASPPTTLKPPPTTLPGHTCDLQISLYRKCTYDPQTSNVTPTTCISPCRERAYDPQTSTYDPSRSHPQTRKSPCRECAYDPQTSIYDPSRSHLYDPEIPHMEGREAGVASRGQSAQRWKDEKHKRGSIGFVGLQCTLPIEERQRKTEKDRERQRKTEKDRKQHTHTLKPRHASPNF